MKLKSNRDYTLVAFLALGAFVFIVCQIVGFDGAYGQDAYEYLRFSERVSAFITSGKPLGDFYWPVGYPSLVGVLNLITNNVFIAGQLISVLSWTITCWVGYKFILLKYPKSFKNSYHTFLYVLIFLGFSPYFFRLGISTMSDVLSALLILLTFYFLTLYHNKKHNYAIVYTILFATLSIIVRNASAVLVVIPLGVLGYDLLKNKKWGYIIVGLIIGLAILSPSFLMSKSQVLDNNYGDMFSFKNFFSTKAIDGDQGRHHFLIPNGIYAFYGFFHPAFLFMGLPLVFLMFYNKMKWDKIILFSVILYAVFIGGIYFQNKRFFVIQLPLIVVLLYPGYAKLFSLKVLKKLKIALPILLLLTNIFLALFTTKKIFNYQQMDKTIAKELKKIEGNTPWLANACATSIAKELKKIEGNTLYIFELEIALKQRGLNVNYINFWDRELNEFKKDSYALFNEEKLKYQWENHVVMKNWDRLKKTHHLKEVMQFKNGFTFYLITDKAP